MDQDQQSKTLNKFDAEEVGGALRSDAVHEQCILLVGRQLELYGRRRRSGRTPDVRQFYDGVLAGEDGR